MIEEIEQAALKMGLLIIFFMSVYFLLYMVPMLIAFGLDHKQRKLITSISLLTGFTFVGWLGTLVWALTGLHHSNNSKGKYFWQRLPIYWAELLIDLHLLSIDDADEYYLSYLSRHAEFRRHKPLSAKLDYLQRQLAKAAIEQNLLKKTHDFQMVLAIFEGLLGPGMSFLDSQKGSENQRILFSKLWKHAEENYRDYSQRLETEQHERLKAEERRQLGERLTGIIHTRKIHLADHVVRLQINSLDKWGWERLKKKGDWVEFGESLYTYKASAIRSPISGFVVSDNNSDVLIDVIPQRGYCIPDHLGEFPFKGYLELYLEERLAYCERFRNNGPSKDEIRSKVWSEVENLRLITQEFEPEIRLILSEAVASPINVGSSVFR